jgi:predicted ATP-grasp superfamily ATP-dependent carboligase
LLNAQKSFKTKALSSRIGEKSVRLLVYEHVSGGGFAAEPLPLSVLSEGFGMLRTLIADFKAAGHNVTTTLDSRIAKLNPPIEADCAVPVSSSKEAQANLQKISNETDAAYVIAPETGGVLQSLVELIEQTNAASLNCPAEAIEKVSDKAGIHDFLKKRGIRIPETLAFSVFDNVAEIKQAIRGKLNFPLIFKPSDGVSCCGLSVARNEDQMAGAVAKIKQASSSKLFLVQELITGDPASVCVFSAGIKAVPVSLNRQEVNLCTPEACSSYSGGLVPFANPLRSEAFEAAEKIVESFPDLRGYIGVDFVLTEDEVVALEVNPRLTTSYVGLRKVVGFNPAQAIINAVLKRELPTNIESCGYAYFSKVEAPNPPVAALQKTYGINDVVSPPFPLSETIAASALIASHGATLNEAKSRFSEAKKRVLNTINRGK